MISDKKYQNLWLAFVQIAAIDGYNFLDLVDFEEKPAEDLSDDAGTGTCHETVGSK